MTLSFKQTLGLLALAIAAVFYFAVMPDMQAEAAPVTQCYDATSHDGTSTLNSMWVGAGTTTLTLANCASGNLADSAFVQFQYTATTTTKLNLRVEHSNNKIDWYPETTTITGSATTTIVAGDSLVYQFNLSTTTDNGGSGTAARLHRSLSISTPTKYTRVIFSVPTGGASGSLWAEVVGRKQF